MKNELLTMEKYITKIADLWLNIKDKIKELAETYVEMIDKYPESKELILKKLDENGATISRHTLNRLEDIGRGRMHWRLMPGFTEINQAAKIRLLPYSDQKEILESDKKWPLLLENGDSILVDFKSCPKKQIEQLIDSDGHIRTLPEQKIWLIDNTNQNVQAKEITDPYKITSRGLEIAGFIFTKPKLKEILMQM